MTKPLFTFVDHNYVNPSIGYFSLKGEYYRLGDGVFAVQITKEEWQDFVSLKAVFPKWLEPAPETLPVYNTLTQETYTHTVISQPHVDLASCDHVIVLTQRGIKRYWVLYNPELDRWEYLKFTDY